MNKRNLLPGVMIFAAVLAAVMWPVLAQPENKKAIDKAKAAEVTPEWIWIGQDGKDNQTVYFRQTFTVDGQLKDSQGGWLIGTCDNAMTVYINGKKVASSDAWETPLRADVTKDLKQGKNIIAVEAKNEGGIAGLLLRLVLQPAAGGRSVVVSDKSWLATEKTSANWTALDFDAKDWKAPYSHGKLGVGPWGDVISGQAGVATVGGKATPGAATAAESVILPPGFKAELLHSVPKGEQGSWVNLTTDHKGRLIASNQNGLLYRITVDKPEKGKVEVEPIEVYIQENGKNKGQPIGKAHGLCWAYDSLYVVICDGGGVGNGLYRLRDTNNDDKLDSAELLRAIQGGGEHGPHAVKLAPDGKLYIIAGNFTKIPDNIEAFSAPKNWMEDHLLPRNPDGNGHDPHIMAPAGWFARTDKDGKSWELISMGMRNSFDIDFNSDGEWFTFDSDMEWDTGTPWYRPTRVSHLVSGGEMGFRNGTGKWPAYYPDSNGPVVDIGMSSPTGVTFGHGAKFPAKYQKAFYICDWTYGKLYAVHMTPQGAGYTGTSEVFAQAKPFPLTDAVIGGDGAMYITIGGRGTQSGLYRVTYTGTESTAPVANVEQEAGKEARALRRKLESFHGKVDAAAVDFALPHLSSSDRAIRFAARVAIEWQPAQTWVDKAFAQTKPTGVINAMLAVARTNDKALLAKAIATLDKLPLARLTEEQQLEALRAYGLVFVRLNEPQKSHGKSATVDPQIAAAVIKKVAPLIGSASESVNREATQILVYLADPAIVPKAMARLSTAQTQEDQLFYAFVLRNATTGWTTDLRKAHFSWMNLAGSKFRGGASFKRFIEQIRKESQLSMTEDEKTALADVIKGTASIEVVKELTPRQFIHNWQMDDLTPVIENAAAGRNFERGKAAFEVAQCAKCHRFGGEGGATGPDLTGVGNRFSAADLLESIVLPSKVVSDQYAPTEIETADGEILVGKIEKEDEKSISLITNPYGGEATVFLKKEIVKRGLSKTSLMPTGLIGILQKDEVLDMIAYLRAAGNKDDKAFAK